MKLDTRYIENMIGGADFAGVLERARAAHETVLRGSGAGSEFLGWRDLPADYDRDEYARVKNAAERIRRDNDVLVVIGIGGSYLGARAVIELLGGADDGLEVIFAGKSLSSIELDQVLRALDGKDWAINVISKSGTTTEPAVAFRILREKLIAKYGDGARERIFVTTDAARGTLKELADAGGYETFTVPDDIGGRYSVLSSVGLLPIAAAGIDIDALMRGAAAARDDLTKSGDNPAIQYAALRNFLYEKGYLVEVLACFEPSFASMNEWWKQLFGESEGKDGKGILPDSLIFTTDLHSLGQYVQDGRRQIFETFINLESSPVDVEVPAGDDGDGLGFLAGKSLNFINQKAYEATALAHSGGGVPVLSLNLPKIDAENIGYLIYFMEVSCAISAYMLGVNPFNQPGVEAYKNNMFKLLGKK